ncbi:MAG: ROK family protein [Planctomycetes bacterium]|nr:ROK family protein [Planctomycetota bacterium]MBI3833518.1 ROK family protein [Planctomycetota bacterium]
MRFPIPIGLAVPGVIDAQAGIVRRSVNLPFLENRPIARDLSEAIQKSDSPTSNIVVLMTDADAATWGEYSTMNPLPRRFAHLRIGTGIALGIVIDGVPQPRDPNRRTHLPLLVVDHSPSAGECPCGLRGCLETIASGPAITSQARAMLGITNLNKLEQAVAQGHPGALDLISNCASAILVACAAIQGEFMVDMISLGGGALFALPSLLESCHSTAKKSRNFREKTLVLGPAALGDNAGVFGAALLAQMHIGC